MTTQIINGDNIVEMGKMEENSIDAIITDPPYGLQFMGKDWDKMGMMKEMQDFHYKWGVEALRVAKPGAHLLSFGGTRVHHRMISGLEDAGWEVRDCLMWVYGCLSEDTEILTPNGWVPYHTTTTFNNTEDHILIYDIQKGIFKWEVPERWSVYKVYEDTCYRIQSDNTDQIVSRNHRCLIEREGKLIFTEAEKLLSMENMPTLPDNFFELYKEQSEILLSAMQWILQRSGVQTTRPQRKICLDGRFQNKFLQKNEWIKQSIVEGGNNILQDTWELCGCEICTLPTGVSTNGEEGWICDGTQIDYCQTIGKMFEGDRSYPSHQSRSNGQFIREFNVIPNQPNAQKIRGYEITRAKITKIKYSGLLFCPTVSTGSFVARRNGKIFITGNSGFPKSHNIGKAIDKSKGVERDVIGINPNHRPNSPKDNIKGDFNPNSEGNKTITAPKSIDAIKWDGWGTALKPSWEPIILCRKPLTKTIAANVLEWGTGGINIDGCRVKTIDNLNGGAYSKGEYDTTDKVYELGLRRKEGCYTQPIGRWPANLIHDGSKEVVELFPYSKSGGLNGWGTAIKPSWEPIVLCRKPFTKTIAANVLEWGTGGINIDGCRVGIEIIKHGNAYAGNTDGRYNWNNGSVKEWEGTISQGRFPANLIHDGSEEVVELFPNSKSSQPFNNKKILRKNDNILSFNHSKDIQTAPNSYGDKGSVARFFYCAKPSSKEKGLDNDHPTVKPIKLLQYLAKLITPPGGVILDPFAGSGSTGLAAREEGFDVIMIEQDKHYCDIIKGRLVV